MVSEAGLYVTFALESKLEPKNGKFFASRWTDKILW